MGARAPGLWPGTRAVAGHSSRGRALRPWPGAGARRGGLRPKVRYLPWGAQVAVWFDGLMSATAVSSDQVQLEACLRAVLSPVDLPAIDEPCAAAAAALIRLLPRPGVRLIVERLRPMASSAEALRARYGLTAREAQVAQLLARGLSNARLAEALGVSIHTAQRHTERVFQKLGIHARAAVAGVIFNGLG